MKVETSNINIQKIDEIEGLKLDSAKVFSYVLAVPEFKTLLAVMDEIQENSKDLKSIEDSEIDKKKKQIEIETKLKNNIASLQSIAENEKVPVKISDIDEIKLLIKRKEFLQGSLHKNSINLDNFSKEEFEFLKKCLLGIDLVLADLNPNELKANFIVTETNSQPIYKSFDFSKGLFNLLEYSYKTQKPVRLDFQGDSSVILRLNSNGKIAAEFISRDKAMEYILKNTIPNLKNKLDSENIPYEEIYYRDEPRKKKKKK
jgi:hypothetical protein